MYYTIKGDHSLIDWVKLSPSVKKALHTYYKDFKGYLILEQTNNNILEPVIADGWDDVFDNWYVHLITFIVENKLKSKSIEDILILWNLSQE